ncbi:MAG: hypothetical protein M3507_05900, partial [Actinomycetota bacterium]|nr:hypothetical protein [Actinomycetota bacterium]
METLSFAGGRLLLRGENGSGKSTAMNMLLPFLLEASKMRSRNCQRPRSMTRPSRWRTSRSTGATSRTS